VYSSRSPVLRRTLAFFIRPHRITDQGLSTSGITDQPTNWPRLYLLPQTHYVRRQRAANSPQYIPWPKAEVSDYGATSKKQTYFQRCIQNITATRDKAWASLKRLGREVARMLTRWCLLPLAIAACFSMVDVSPSELPEAYYAIEEVALIAR
jgi:hypothetical protein